MSLKTKAISIASLAVVMLLLSSGITAAQSDTKKEKKMTPEELITQFQSDWDAEEWGQQFRGMRYMRTLDEEGWQSRMLTLQKLVQAEEKALPALMKSLGEEDVPTQILAAQSLSFLAPHADVDAMVDAFKSAEDAAVRLYLVDAIGMSGKGKDVDWDTLDKNERNRDVRKHIGYAKAREDNAIDKEVVESLVKWDAKTMASVKVGEAAPDFELATFDGKKYSLKQFKGKQPVVLVFVYGDT